ncbi:addiction module antidote protein, HigA family [Caulobacter sp. B11]|uniref:HigA family addiction module antitoxin n=1 Tax=Caulobacter sp. B11 TaxID=2048899 RepID=UPI000C12B1C7|nr:HigA family addiction module antitoxin [Caulobacter sp. B11]PHY14128.1 addiction module antidote protein, HigA family [Caulobacter sp. B11]
MDGNFYNTETPHPGFFLKEELEERGWSQRDLAYILGTPEQAVNLILAGKRGISPEMAKALGTAFDVHADLFANLQRAYDMSRARDPDPSVGRRARLQSAYPVREMIKRGWLEDTDAALLEAQMACFFEVANSNEIPHMEHAARKTAYDESPPAQVAWLFRVRQIARSTPVGKYSEAALREALPRLRALMIDPQEARHVPRILAECGVRLIFVERLPNAKIDGVCLWLNKQSPVIGMSLRHDRIDNFWFVLRHEIEHVLRKDGQSKPIIDVDLDDTNSSEPLPPEEIAANAAAAEFCIPEKEISLFIARKSPFFAERDIVGFSKRLQIHPGLVVGQIQKKTKRWDLLRKHLVKIRLHVLPGAVVDGWGQQAAVPL